MTNRARRRSASEAAADGSSLSAAVRGASDRLRTLVERGGAVGALVLLMGLSAAILLIAAELSTYREIEVLTASCEELTRSTPDVAEDCVTTGAEQHNLALLLIAVVVLLMTLGAGPGRSLPAAAALVALGVLVLAIALLGDAPDTDVTGAVGRNFDQAEGKAGPTVTLEIIGALLALAAGGLGLAARRARASA